MFGDGSRLVPCRCLVALAAPPHLAPLFLRAVITADCMSQRPALIGLSLYMHLEVGWGDGGWGVGGGGGWEEPPYVGLPWRLGRLMSEPAVTNDIPEPIGYSANGQFAASLTNDTQIEGAHTSAWSELTEWRAVLAVNQYMTSGRKACHLRHPPPPLHIQRLIVLSNKATANVMWPYEARLKTRIRREVGHLLGRSQWET